MIISDLLYHNCPLFKVELNLTHDFLGDGSTLVFRWLHVLMTVTPFNGNDWNWTQNTAGLVAIVFKGLGIQSTIYLSTCLSTYPKLRWYNPMFNTAKTKAHHWSRYWINHSPCILLRFECHLYVLFLRQCYMKKQLAHHWKTSLFPFLYSVINTSCFLISLRDIFSKQLPMWCKHVDL
jgi:hypothetical protein